MPVMMTVRDYYKQKNILITGGGGYLGKMLIEKLLRSCPDIGNIYTLLRPKKGKNAEERIKSVTDAKLFSIIKEINPVLLTKIIPVNGDVSELGLGLSQEDRAILIENVHIIFHAAASIRFDDHLKYALLLNTRGTREIINLSFEMKNIEMFVYVSTVYCNLEQPVIEEKIYPASVHWRDAIEIAETLDEYSLDKLSQKYIHPHPNTYTFSKLLAENIVRDLCDGKIPALILRPSIIIPAYKEPLPGWVDNYFGPTGLLLAGGLGLLHVMYSEPELPLNMIPVDYVTRLTLLATYKKGLERNNKDLEVYNSTLDDYMRIKDLEEMGKSTIWQIPFRHVVWYPQWITVKSFLIYYLGTLFMHVLPALLIDSVLAFTKFKVRLFKLYKKIYIANMAITFFTFKSWNFVYDKSLHLDTVLNEDEKEEFGLDSYRVWNRRKLYEYYAITCKKGAEKYLLGFEHDKSKGQKALWRMYILDKLLKVALVVLFSWIIFIKIDIVSVFVNKFESL